MKFIKQVIRGALKSMGYEVYNTKLPYVYSEDGLSTYHNHSFIHDADFQAAYARAREAIDGEDHKMRWRVHVALWVASQVIDLDGDFVECGVSRGFLTSAIMQYLNWNKLGRDFYLFDTFAGLDPRFVTESEAEDGRLERFAGLRLDRVQENFAEFENVHFVVGAVPETLDEVEINKVCYLSLDMNCTEPEIAALAHFWDRLVPGAIVLMDDYAYSGYEAQNAAFNAFACEKGTQILSLPTGQGIIVKKSASTG